MSNYALKPSSPLKGYSKTIGETTIQEITDLATVSISVPRSDDGLDRLNAAMTTSYGAAFPATGKSTVSADGHTRFLGMSPDQAFAIFKHDGVDADLLIKEKLGTVGYYTFQSDNWVVLRVSGNTVRTALERICQIDLSADVFADGDVARTVMEHMGAIILRDGDDSFILMSAWSSAESFLHAVEVSATNIC